MFINGSFTVGRRSQDSSVWLGVGLSESDPVIATWSGDLDYYQQIFSTGPQMFIKWSSSADTVRQGFKLKYTSTPAIGICVLIVL